MSQPTEATQQVLEQVALQRQAAAATTVPEPDLAALALVFRFLTLDQALKASRASKHWRGALLPPIGSSADADAATASIGLCAELNSPATQLPALLASPAYLRRHIGSLKLGLVGHVSKEPEHCDPLTRLTRVKRSALLAPEQLDQLCSASDRARKVRPPKKTKIIRRKKPKRVVARAAPPRGPNDIVEALPRNKWIPDSCALWCKYCMKDFSFFRRRHHCRECGEVACSPCSQWKATFGMKREMLRVCTDCQTARLALLFGGPPMAAPEPESEYSDEEVTASEDEEFEDPSALSTESPLPNLVHLEFHPVCSNAAWHFPATLRSIVIDTLGTYTLVDEEADAAADELDSKLASGAAKEEDVPTVANGDRGESESVKKGQPGFLPSVMGVDEGATQQRILQGLSVCGARFESVKLLLTEDVNKTWRASLLPLSTLTSVRKLFLRQSRFFARYLPLEYNQAKQLEVAMDDMPHLTDLDVNFPLHQLARTSAARSLKHIGALLPRDAALKSFPKIEKLEFSSWQSGAEWFDFLRPVNGAISMSGLRILRLTPAWFESQGESTVNYNLAVRRWQCCSYNFGLLFPALRGREGLEELHWATLLQPLDGKKASSEVMPADLVACLPKSLRIVALGITTIPDPRFAREEFVTVSHAAQVAAANQLVSALGQLPRLSECHLFVQDVNEPTKVDGAEIAPVDLAPLLKAGAQVGGLESLTLWRLELGDVRGQLLGPVPAQAEVIAQMTSLKALRLQAEDHNTDELGKERSSNALLRRLAVHGLLPRLAIFEVYGWDLNDTDPSAPLPVDQLVSARRLQLNAIRSKSNPVVTPFFRLPLLQDLSFWSSSRWTGNEAPSAEFIAFLSQLTSLEIGTPWKAADFAELFVHMTSLTELRIDAYYWEADQWSLLVNECTVKQLRRLEINQANDMPLSALRQLRPLKALEAINLESGFLMRNGEQPADVLRALYQRPSPWWPRLNSVQGALW